MFTDQVQMLTSVELGRGGVWLGLLLALPPEQVRDLIGYLMHPVQVPLPK